MTLSEELKAMLEKAHRYTASAELLKVQKDFDSAISRLYYAMFYCAEALLLSKGLTFSSHKAVISGFAQSFVKPNLVPRNLHQWLCEAFEKRQISEYDFLSGANEDEVKDLAEKARQFLSMTHEILKLPE